MKAESKAKSAVLWLTNEVEKTEKEKFPIL